MHVCDFSRSFITFRIDTAMQPATTFSDKPNYTANNARIQLESLCELTRQGGPTVQYFLGASCKTERVNVAEDIWLQPNADFCMIVSAEHFLIIKRYDSCSRKMMYYPPSLGEQPHRQSGQIQDAYTKLSVDLQRMEGHLLETVPEAVDLGFANCPLIGITEFKTDDGFDVRLEYPIKTINLGDRELFYQTDTGPVLFPQQPSQHEPPIESFDLAYIAVNSKDWAELLLNAPAEVASGVTVPHFSKPVKINCTNRLVALT